MQKNSAFQASGWVLYTWGNKPSNKKDEQNNLNVDINIKSTFQRSTNGTQIHDNIKNMRKKNRMRKEEKRAYDVFHFHKKRSFCRILSFYYFNIYAARYFSYSLSHSVSYFPSATFFLVCIFLCDFHSMLIWLVSNTYSFFIHHHRCIIVTIALKLLG